MSWDATLICESCGSSVGEWNYTHNVNGMIRLAGIEAGVLPALDGDRPSSWWRHLDGMPGPAGALMLAHIIEQLEADPQRFRGMNPANLWGHYDELLVVLREMRDAVPENLTRWSVGG